MDALSGDSSLITHMGVPYCKRSNLGLYCPMAGVFLSWYKHWKGLSRLVTVKIWSDIFISDLFFLSRSDGSIGLYLII